jgi:hypothetical protein
MYLYVFSQEKVLSILSFLINTNFQTTIYNNDDLINCQYNCFYYVSLRYEKIKPQEFFSLKGLIRVIDSKTQLFLQFFSIPHLTLLGKFLVFHHLPNRRSLQHKGFQLVPFHRLYTRHIFFRIHLM